jgi:hypothetical protein
MFGTVEQGMARDTAISCRALTEGCRTPKLHRTNQRMSDSPLISNPPAREPTKNSRIHYGEALETPTSPQQPALCSERPHNILLQKYDHEYDIAAITDSMAFGRE